MSKSVFLFLFSLFIPRLSLGQEIKNRFLQSDSILKMEWKIWKSRSAEEKNTNIWHVYSWHKQNKNYEKALVALNRMNSAVWNNQQIGNNLEVQKGLILFLLGSHEEALKQMLLMENTEIGKEDKKMVYYILVQSFIDQGDYLVSKNKLAKLVRELSPETGENLISTFDSLCQRAIGVRQKSVSKARKLSIYLPSAGLFYSGNPGTAFKNLGLQTAAAGYLTWNILAQNYFTAATVNLHLLRLFYAGGVNQSGHLTTKYNMEKTREARLELSFFLARTIKSL